MKLQDLKNKKFVKAEFNRLKESDKTKLKFHGVYIIYDDSDEILYVGSAYVKTIHKRLLQYLSPTDTGNTLMHAICRADHADVTKISQITEEYKTEAIEKIKKLHIIGIEYEDLEYQLIKLAKPKYNTLGAEIDTVINTEIESGE